MSRACRCACLVSSRTRAQYPPAPAPRPAGPVPALLGWDASTGPPERQQAKGKLDNLQACGPLRATWLRSCPAGSRGARRTGPLGRWGVPGSCRSAPPRPVSAHPSLLRQTRLPARPPATRVQDPTRGGPRARFWERESSVGPARPRARPACLLTFRKPPPVPSMTAAPARALQSSGRSPASPA